MTYAIVKQLIPQNKYKLKATYAMTPEYITVHNTANDASAANEIKYMSSNNNATSYHVAIDDKEAIEAIPFSRTAWHCGDGTKGKGNRSSIGIEICYSKSGGQRYVEAEENAVQYIAHVLHERGWGVDRVKQHYDWSRKNCPHRIRDEGRWQSFLSRVQQALNALKGFSASMRPPSTPSTPTPAQTDVSAKIGYSNTDDANTFRIQSGKFTSLEDAQAAAESLLHAGMLGYVTVLGYKE